MTLHRQNVACACGFECEYLIEWPPIPAIVVRFVDDEWQGEECPHCDEPLRAPDGMPDPGTYTGVYIGVVQEMIRQHAA